MIDWILVVIMAILIVDYVRIARRLLRAETDALQMRDVARFLLHADGGDVEAKIDRLIQQMR